MPGCLTRYACLFSAMVLLVLPACRPQEPPPLVAENLGTPERPLLPSLDAVPGYDRSIMDGRATPVEVGEAVEDAKEEEDEHADEDLPEGVRKAIEEIVEMAIGNVADSSFDDITELIAPDQQEAAGKVLAVVAKLSKANQDLLSVMENKAPEVLENMRSMSSAMMGSNMPDGLRQLAAGEEVDAEALKELITVGGIEMAAEDRAVAKLVAMDMEFPATFRLVDDEWYLHIPVVLDDAELVDAIVRVGDTVEEKLRGVIGQLEDGSLAPENLQSAMMAMQGEITPVVMSDLVPKLMPLFAGAQADVESAGDDEADADEAEDAEAEPDADDAEAGDADAEADDEGEADEQEQPASGRGRGRGRGR